LQKFLPEQYSLPKSGLVQNQVLSRIQERTGGVRDCLQTSLGHASP